MFTAVGGELVRLKFFPVGFVEYNVIMDKSGVGCGLDWRDACKRFAVCYRESGLFFLLFIAEMGDCGMVWCMKFIVGLVV